MPLRHIQQSSLTQRCCVSLIFRAISTRQKPCSLPFCSQGLLSLLWMLGGAIASKDDRPIFDVGGNRTDEVESREENCPQSGFWESVRRLMFSPARKRSSKWQKSRVMRNWNPMRKRNRRMDVGRFSLTWYFASELSGFSRNGRQCQRCMPHNSTFLPLRGSFLCSL